MSDERASLLAVRYLRSSFFADMTHPPMTTVASEADLKDTLEGAREFLLRGSVERGGFALFEIFESDRDIHGATIEAMERINKETEQHMAILFFHMLSQMPLMRQGGMILPDPNADGYPAPMRADQAEVVLEQIALAPGYKPSVTVRTDTQDGAKLKLLNGEVTRVG